MTMLGMELADTIEAERMKRERKRKPTPIDVLVPMLGRAHQIGPLLASLDASHEEKYPVRVVFVVSPGDEPVIAALRELNEEHIVADWEPGPGDYAKKINLGFRETDAPWVLLGASDLRFHARWASNALKTPGRRAVIGTNDLGNPLVRAGKHSTHPIVSRAYVEEVGASFDGPGFVYHEGYDHQYVDTELVELAMRRGEWSFAVDSLVEHLHPLWGKGEMDSTYKRGMAKGRLDANIYRQRRSEWQKSRA